MSVADGSRPMERRRRVVRLRRGAVIRMVGVGGLVTVGARTVNGLVGT
jgi:hypothetical protein